MKDPVPYDPRFDGPEYSDDPQDSESTGQDAPRWQASPPVWVVLAALGLLAWLAF